MTKKEQKQWLLDQINLAILDVPGEYAVEGHHHVFRVPKTTCVYKICTTPDPVEYRLTRLAEFKTKINKSKAFTNVRGVPTV